MNRSSTSVKLVLGLVLLGLIAWGLYASIEFYEETEESGWSIDALRNPYLAAQKFMTESDIEVTEASVRSFSAMPTRCKPRASLSR
jgi:hypothetical protein